jgi:uncharacterized Zn finger protein (UPF0148 family)
MLKKKCASCGVPLDKDWNFCPNCGASLRGVQGGTGGGLDINKMVQQMVGPLLNTMMGGMFQTQAQPKHTHRNPLEKRTEPIEEVIEPEEAVTDLRDSVAHVITLPEVKSKSDINIIKMENSIEVRAVVGKKLYLKIIKREKGEGILSEEFSKGNLVIVLKKI